MTHPVPDNTGYITEGQFYLHDGAIDPFGSLSRLKQQVVGKVTREDHPQVMNAMVRLYSGAQEAEKKQAMAFELSPFDHKLLRFGDLFRERFMNIEVSMALDDALDLGVADDGRVLWTGGIADQAVGLGQVFPWLRLGARIVAFRPGGSGMAHLPLNKSSLKQERNRLATYARFLPSLDLKRRQLMWELRRAERELAEIEADISRLAESAQDLFALVGSVDMKLAGLVRVRQVDLAEENVVGVRLPRIAAIDIEVAEYSTLAKPFWLDALADKLRAMLELRAHRGVGGERLRRLERAVRKVTQRVNLFEKVLIPQARANISRIQIHLADAERAAVVRSKIMKANRQQRPAVA